MLDTSVMVAAIRSDAGASRHILRAAFDPDDDMVVESAVNGRADAIVTFNLRHLGLAFERFGMPVLPPSEAVRRMEKRL